MGIVRAGTGQVVARYSYDAWGKCTVTNAGGYTVGAKNPFRYRGYYYDAETGFYYLNSRYYNPEWGRFISADVFVSTGQGLTGANMFAYCGNNPVNYTDPSGMFAKFADDGKGKGNKTEGKKLLPPNPGFQAPESNKQNRDNILPVIGLFGVAAIAGFGLAGAFGCFGSSGYSVGISLGGNFSPFTICIMYAQ